MTPDFAYLVSRQKPRTHDSAERWAVEAVQSMRAAGEPPRGILRAFERHWNRATEPTWDDVVDEVAIAWLTVGNISRSALQSLRPTVRVAA